MGAQLKPYYELNTVLRLKVYSLDRDQLSSVLGLSNVFMTFVYHPTTFVISPRYHAGVGMAVISPVIKSGDYGWRIFDEQSALM